MDHAVLLNKLSNLWIVDKEHGWFTDYLSNCTQIVEFQGVTSTPEAISLGVPQGSILSPLLFILHNDFPEVVSECNILKYDTAHPPKPLWLSFNSLFIYVTKTYAMLLELPLDYLL